jgi:hypothetical protein
MALVSWYGITRELARWALVKECEHNDGISAWGIELIVSTGGHGEVLDTIDLVGHGCAADPRAGGELPEEFTGLGIEGVEGAGSLSYEE